MIKKFDEFYDSIDENKYHEYRSYSHAFGGKTKFSQWLRTIDNNLKWETRELVDRNQPGTNDMGSGTVNSIKSLGPTLGRLIARSTAAIADLLTPSGNHKRKYTKNELKTDKKEIIDDWKRKEIEGKTVTEKEAEKFYKSGVLKGKEYFGKDYKPMKPRNQDEKEYSDYLLSAMEQYHDNIKR